MFESERNQRATAGVEAHVRDFFTGHAIAVSDYDLGPGRREAVPSLRIVTVSPGPRADSWACITAGCWSTVEADGHGLEFVLTAPVRDERFADRMLIEEPFKGRAQAEGGESSLQCRPISSTRRGTSLPRPQDPSGRSRRGAGSAGNRIPNSAPR
ncbi:MULTISPECIES: hypothetical protein [unclassified Streptomyces]|uniref:hypothetical protein n=1 Tax=unclassified Streptomyces TaxID=2593676 RepID=UPI003D73B735